MSRPKLVVKITANFTRNLDSIEQFLNDADAPQAYDRLLDELTDTLIPNLERFPDLGRPFLVRPAGSVEVSNGQGALRQQLQALAGGGELREYLMPDYLVLYLRQAQAIYLLAIKHHRQLSFDFERHWDSP